MLGFDGMRGTGAIRLITQRSAVRIVLLLPPPALGDLLCGPVLWGRVTRLVIRGRLSGRVRFSSSVPPRSIGPRCCSFRTRDVYGYLPATPWRHATTRKVGKGPRDTG
jgi:hypothetical protein